MMDALEFRYCMHFFPCKSLKTVSLVSQQAAGPHSGHYQPTVENFQDFLSFLQENNVDLTNVKVNSTPGFVKPSSH